MSGPHITLKREGASSDGWCIHYSGFFEPGSVGGKKTHCDAGVEYISVETKVDFTYGYPGEHVYTKHVAHPCFKREHHLTKGCDKCQFPTPEEIKAHHKDVNALVNRVSTARAAILNELARRWKDDGKVTQIKIPSDLSRFVKPQINYFCGSGKMKCPICNSGELSYSRSTYNGHVHARCSTNDCVWWME